MLQTLPQNTIIPPLDTEKTVRCISGYLEKYNGKGVISVDISGMNVLDACRVSALCSAKHYVNYPNDKIVWKVSSELVSNLNKDLGLGNCIYDLISQQTR